MSQSGDRPEVLRIEAGSPALGRLYPWLDAVAAPHGLPASTLNAMHVALEEAVMNVITHGRTPDTAAPVTVRFSADGQVAALVVEDSGAAFDPAAAALRPPPANLGEAVPGGLGLRLLRHFCRDVRYERVGHMNRLTLRFPVPGPS